jgi:hypothetical protein
MYKIGDKLEVATKMLTMDIPYETKIMTVTAVYEQPWQTYYCFGGNNNIQYPSSRIIRKVG